MDPIKQPNKPTNNKAMHTLSEDMAIAIQDNKDGFVKKIIHEQEDKETEKQILAVYARRNKIYLVLALLFVIMASGAIGYLFFKDSVDSFFVKNRFAPLIFHESSQVLDITGKNRENILSMIQGLMLKAERESGVVEGVYFLDDKKTVGFNKFLSLIQSNFLGTSDLFNENFLVGIIKQSSIDNVAQESNATKETQPEIDKTNKKLEDYITLSTTSFFKTGTTEFVDIEAKNKAKELISYFLDTVSFDTSKVQIIGTFSTERPWVKNQEIAEARKKIGLSIFDEVLKEKYTTEQVAKISIDSSARGVAISDIYNEEEIAQMSEAFKNEKIDLNQGITYLAEAKVKSATVENMVNEVFVVDNSPKAVNSIFPKGTDLFILLKVNSFADVFNQMRGWENKMFADLHGFLGVEIFADTSYLLTKDFVDGVVQNKNARILYDDTGKIVFMYVYVDDSSVVITSNEEVTREVILRVNSSKIKR